jgi:hypothetical protein
VGDNEQELVDAVASELAQQEVLDQSLSAPA